MLPPHDMKKRAGSRKNFNGREVNKAAGELFYTFISKEDI